MIILKEGSSSHFNEKLEVANQRQFDLLKKQIESDPETKRMLTSPLSSIPQYRWLYRGESQYALVEEHSLFDAILLFVLAKKLKVLFSKVGNKFIGFLAYKEDGTEITKIKMASFLDDTKKTNPALAVDLSGFLKKEISKRTKIQWVADNDNKKAISQYDALLNKDRYVWNKAKANDGMVIYTVTGKSK